MRLVRYLSSALFIMLLCLASGKVMSQPSMDPSEIPHCQARDEATGCLALLHVGETFSLAPGEEFACRLDFSTCDGSIRNTKISMISSYIMSIHFKQSIWIHLAAGILAIRYWIMTASTAAREFRNPHT